MTTTGFKPEILRETTTYPQLCELLIAGHVFRLTKHGKGQKAFWALLRDDGTFNTFRTKRVGVKHCVTEAKRLCGYAK